MGSRFRGRFLRRLLVGGLLLWVLIGVLGVRGGYSFILVEKLWHAIFMSILGIFSICPDSPKSQAHSL